MNALKNAKKLLSDEKMRADIAEKGRIRCLRNGIFQRKQPENNVGSSLCLMKDNLLKIFLK